MISARFNVFETNSSSTHAICICTENEFKEWQDGKKIWNHWDEEIVDIPNPQEYEENDYKYKTYEEFSDGYEYETYERHFTTPAGEEMVAFGYYGHD